MDEFETLLASGKTAVERWVRARTSRPADAEDILQEIYLAAFQSFSGLRNHNAFLPWILSIAKRKYADCSGVIFNPDSRSDKRTLLMITIASPLEKIQPSLSR